MSEAMTQNKALRWEAIRWMLWKENRLVVPLFVSLVGAFAMVVILQSVAQTDFGSINSVPIARSAGIFIPLLFPVLMASGLGLILVGQEREQGILAWLRSLPLSPKMLLTIKYAVAAGWMILAWLLAMLVGAGQLISWTEIAAMPSDGLIPLSYPFWIVQSVWVLLASFYASCRWQSAQTSVLGLIAIASIPAIISGVLGSFMHDSNAILRVTFWITAMLIPVLAGLTYREAIRMLSPAAGTAGVARSARAHLGGNAEKLNPGGISYGGTLFGSATPAMIWHTLRSNRVLTTAVVAVVVCGIIGPMFIGYFDIKKTLPSIVLSLPAMLLPVAVCWAGVSVFQNDGSADRLRFLADRGIEPLRIFWTRYLPMVSVLCLLAVVYTAVATSLVIMDETERQWLVTLPSLLTITVLGVILFAVGSWTSQLVRGPVISYLVSPIAALTVLVWLGFAYGQAMTPMWLAIVVGIVVPIAVTLVMMRRFVEGRDRPISFFVSGIAAALIFAVPLVPAIVHVRSIKTMPSDRRARLLAEARLIVENDRDPVLLNRAEIPKPGDYAKLQQSTSRDPDAAWQETDADAIDSVSAWLGSHPNEPAELISGLDQLVANQNLPATMVNATFIFGHLELAKLAATDAESIAELQPWVDAASIIAAGLRRSTRLRDQETADDIEIWIADTLVSPQLASTLDSDRAEQALARLPSIAGRNASRRRAVLAKWGRYLKQKPKHRSFGIDRGIQYQAAALSPWTKDRRAESIVMTLLDAVENPASPTWRKEMHRLISHPATQFDESVYGDTFRELPATKITSLDQRFPARYWGMAWENDLQQRKDQDQ